MGYIQRHTETECSFLGNRSCELGSGASSAAGPALTLRAGPKIPVLMIVSPEVSFGSFQSSRKFK
jgi:hypothetical protein